MSHAFPVRKLQISGFEPALRWPPHCDSIMVAGSSAAGAEELWDGCGCEAAFQLEDWETDMTRMTL